jgi:hypothetical protein
MVLRRKVIAGTVAALAVGGASAGVAATKLVNQSPSEESKAIVNDAAKNLGVEPTKLSAAIKKALEDRVDAAVAAGRLTKAQGDELKKRIESDEFPLFGVPGFGFRHGGPGFGFGGPPELFKGLDGVASYLGLTEAKLRAQLNDGKSLAQIAKAQGKSVSGLEAMLKKNLQDKLDAAVKAGKLSKENEQRVLKGFDKRIDEFVNGQLRFRFHDRHAFGQGFGFPPRRFDPKHPPMPDTAA